MLASVTVGVIFSYPSVFMSGFPAGALSGLPNHVWTRPIVEGANGDVQADLEMRQVWLQGDYMQALDRSLLQEALSLEQLLIDSSHSTSPSKGVEWDFLSPCAYWQHIRSVLDDDRDPIRTINEYSGAATLLGHDVQPQSAFAGKKYHLGKLVQADALVITMVNRINASVGHELHQNMIALKEKAPSAWDLGSLPANSSVYEYRYQPFGLRQYWALIGAYSCMVVYVALCLNRLKAFRSRFGLVVTAITQMTTSILASFTICGLLKINLEQIPQEAYPFVVLAIGLENIFRLINAVIAYPPEMATNQRIANGMADIGAASMVSAAQNLAVLWALSLFVSPGVAAFCAFAAIALLLDFFFLITFFLAVLNVDVKRFELQDSLTRSKFTIRATKADHVPKRRSWIDALIHGGVPFSTRMAGSVVTITFVLSLNWHLSDSTLFFFARAPWSSWSDKKGLPTFASDQGSVNNLNRTFNPATWIQSTGYSAATPASFMHIIKPAYESFTSRIYDPMIIVLHNADRTTVPPVKDHFFHALRDFATRHFYPFALAIVFMIAFTTILMNFLLWDERTEPPIADADSAEDPPFSCSTIATKHSLDIVVILASETTHLLTVGLDKRLGITDHDSVSAKQSSTRLATVNFEDASEGASIFSDGMDRLASDPQSDWYAAITRTGRLILGRSKETDISSIVDLSKASESLPGGADTLLVFAVTTDATGITRLLILHVDGTLQVMNVAHSEFDTYRLDTGDEDVVCAQILHAEGSWTIALLTDLGSVLTFVSPEDITEWSLVSPNGQKVLMDIAPPVTHQAWWWAEESLGLVALCTPDEVVFIDITTLQHGEPISTTHAKRHSVRLLHSHATRCPTCSTMGSPRLSIAYTDALSGDLRIHTFSRKDVSSSSDHNESPLICPASAKSACKSLADVDMTVQQLSNPGAWEATGLSCVAGLRVVQGPETSTSVAQYLSQSPSSGKSSSLPLESPLRRRRRVSASKSRYLEDKQIWEAYIFTHLGGLHTLPVKDFVDGEDALFADEPGPVTNVSGNNTVAVAAGNRVVLIQVRDNPDADPVDAARKYGGGAAGQNLQVGSVGVRRSASRGRRGGLAGLARR